LFLGDQDVDDLLLPSKYVPESWNIGDSIEVFCYLDHEERPVATTIRPYVKRNQFGFLRVADVNEYGAFVDWGLEKHLLVPFKQQRERMEAGKWYVVFCYLDEKSFRLVASSKLDAFLSNENLTVVPGDEVDLLVSRKSDLGWDVVVNDSHKGLVFSSDIFKKLSVGERLKGYIRNIRPDNKLDVVLEPIGQSARLSSAERIYTILREAKGFLPLHDKSDPADIQQALQISKKNFKKAIGTLYRERKIEIRDDGIYMVKSATK
jgi:predicted RNA-binding protein (virulence factor B family)